MFIGVKQTLTSIEEFQFWQYCKICYKSVKRYITTTRIAIWLYEYYIENMQDLADMLIDNYS